MKNNMKKVLSLLLAVLMMASMSVTVFADEPTQSLANFTDDTMSDTLDLNYTVTHEAAYAELSAVKLEWEVPVLKLTKSDVRTWNTTKLEWEQKYEESTDGDSVKFTLTNRGTYAVKANVSFTQDSGIETANTVTVAYGEKDPEDENKTINGNDPTLPSVVGTDHAVAENASTIVGRDITEGGCTATIKGKVTISNLANLTNTSGKLGTYTVTISDPSAAAAHYIGEKHYMFYYYSDIEMAFPLELTYTTNGWKPSGQALIYYDVDNNGFDDGNTTNDMAYPEGMQGKMFTYETTTDKSGRYYAFAGSLPTNNVSRDNLPFVKITLCSQTDDHTFDTSEIEKFIFETFGED